MAGPQKLGFIGLGLIGEALSTNAMADGHIAFGYDVDAERMTHFETTGGTALDSPRAVAEHADIIFVAVASLGALPLVIDGQDGIITAGRDDIVVVDLGTLPPGEKLEAKSACDRAGISMLDCTISGTGAQAAARDLVFMASGDPAAIERVRPVIEPLGTAVHNVGEFGNGIRMKFIANHLVGIHNAATAEALLLAERAGIDMHEAIDVLGNGAGGSRMFQVRGPLIADRTYDEPTAKVSLFIKDLSLITKFAEEVGSPTPLLDVTYGLYQQAMEQGLAGYDAAAVHKVLEDREGR